MKQFSIVVFLEFAVVTVFVSLSKFKVRLSIKNNIFLVTITHKIKHTNEETKQS